MLKTTFPVLPDQLEKDMLDVFKLVSDKTRLRIVMFLAANGEQDVSTLCKVLEQSQPLVSHHLALLRMKHLIRMRRDGKHNFYSVSSECVQQIVERLFGVIEPSRNEIRMDRLCLSLRDDDLNPEQFDDSNRLAVTSASQSQA